MPDKPPNSRPEPKPGPSVYGGQWGGGGEQDPRDIGAKDRPDRIKVPDEPQGSGEDGPLVKGQGDS